jgi:tetratricopeptide (TPR) repeat protein
MRGNQLKHGASVLILALFIILALGSGSTEKSVKEPETAQIHFERGEEFFNNKDYSSAIKEFTRVIEMDPNFVRAYAARGLAYFYKDNSEYKRALDDFNKVIELDPQYYPGYFNRAFIYFENVKYSSSYGVLLGEFEFPRVIGQYTEDIRRLDLALADMNKAQELAKSEDRKKAVTAMINNIQTYKKELEDKRAPFQAKLDAIEEANRYDPAKFIIVPADFKPADYTKADLFDAIAAAEKLDIAESYGYGYSTTPSKEFVSDVVFVSQNGTDITFKTADNAISRRFKIESRAGLSAGQRVRVYYKIARLENNSWVHAIERL